MTSVTRLFNINPPLSAHDLSLRVADLRVQRGQHARQQRGAGGRRAAARLQARAALAESQRGDGFGRVCGF